ncbi:hypothetical protein AB0K00_20190 [Dactylosporangium sp. NPDC049525]|uniref:hypothetical protein n=1 Tax=Dactylosporangium sp. NPDC049525 TaxID=3154730 RepID=UPI003412D159
MRFEQLLHETIDEMAGELRGPSAGLAARSMAKGRRIRRTRRLGVAAGAVLAVVAVALPWVVLSWPGGTAPSPMPAASGPPAASAPRSMPPSSTATPGLPGGWVVTGIGDQVLDRATGEYISMQQPVTPAPAGNRVLILDGPSSVQITDVRGTNPVTVDPDGIIGFYSWSPAGDRLAAGITQKEPFKVGFAVIDAHTGTIGKHWIDVDRYDCSECIFTWTRDGREVSVPIADRSGGEAEERVSRLQFFNVETGAPTRSLPVTAVPFGPYSWSPDGRHVIAGPPGGAPTGRLYDVATGQSQPFPHDAVWISDSALLAPQDGKVLTLRPDGTVTATTDVGQGAIQLGPPG